MLNPIKEIIMLFQINVLRGWFLIGYFEQANEYYYEKDYKKAIEIYNKAIKNRENEIGSVHNIALCYIKLKQYNRAIPLLKITVVKEPTGHHFLNLAYGYMMVENLKKALIYFNTAWSLSPENRDCELMINYILNIYIKGGSVDK